MAPVLRLVVQLVGAGGGLEVGVAVDPADLPGRHLERGLLGEGVRPGPLVAVAGLEGDLELLQEVEAGRHRDLGRDAVLAAGLLGPGHLPGLRDG